MHNIKYFIYKEDVNRKAVQRKLDNFVAKEDWYEGCTGLDSPIRWIENCGVFDNYDEAWDYIKSHDKGWYDSLAVRFRQYDVKETASLKKAKEKLRTSQEKCETLERKFHFADAQASFIGCHECGSKISRNHLRSNFCPVCQFDLRPKSTQDTIARYKKKVAEALDLVREEERKSILKNSKVKWLVKIEWHT